MDCDHLGSLEVFDAVGPLEVIIIIIFNEFVSVKFYMESNNPVLAFKCDCESHGTQIAPCRSNIISISLYQLSFKTFLASDQSI